MAEPVSPHHTQLKELIDQLQERLQKTTRVGGKFDIDELHQLRGLSSGLALFLASMATTLGECRKETPYSPLQPILDASGNLKWCCTSHTTTHCSS